MATMVTDAQELPGSVSFTDAAGQPGAVIDAGSLAYAVDDTALANVVSPDPQDPAGDPATFVIQWAGQKLGMGQLQVTATSGGGANQLTGVGSFQFVAGDATQEAVNFGAPRPAAAPAPTGKKK